MLDFRTDTFLCICRHMSYTRAAEELNMTQPGVSQHVRYLETFYGARLFQYEGRRLHLTEAGERLRKSLLAMKHDCVHLQSQLQEHTEGKRELRFGATLTIGEFYLPERLPDYIRNHPELEVGITIGDTRELLAKLDNGDLEFAMVEGYFQKDQYEYLDMGDQEYLLVRGSDYAFHPVRDIQEIFGNTLIVREDGSGTKEILERMLSEIGYSTRNFNQILTMNSIHLVKKMVQENLGISFIYRLAVEEELKKGSMKEIHIPNMRIRHGFSYIWRKDSQFGDYFREIFKELCR